MPRYRIVEHENCNGAKFYTVQAKYRWWPFWMTECEMIHPDLPDPPRIFDHKEKAYNWIKRVEASEYKVAGYYDVK